MSRNGELTNGGLEVFTSLNLGKQLSLGSAGKYRKVWTNWYRKFSLAEAILNISTRFLAFCLLHQIPKPFLPLSNLPNCVLLTHTLCTYMFFCSLPNCIFLY